MELRLFDSILCRNETSRRGSTLLGLFHVEKLREHVANSLDQILYSQLDDHEKLVDLMLRDQRSRMISSHPLVLPKSEGVLSIIHHSLSALKGRVGGLLTICYVFWYQDSFTFMFNIINL